ncbi:flagellar basal body rod protein FlgC [Fodinicurvata fenggangensis]|uniref:flagellar basal body rod protein FlgC n=1 Tax=Fodinicurvata fenggangensis TaxID=1121830 RepID=UPI00047C5E57|nr:flagellar basal body rod protein FlgC [Fodinicurvata fenggangensis]
MDLFNTLTISADGMKAQGTRLRTIAENLANADSTALEPGGEPYQRKVVNFQNVLNREIGAETVEVGKVTLDQSEFGQRFDPGHPAANEDGYVLLPNVNSLIELTDMREAQRSYEANLRVQQSSRRMLEQTINLLR